MSYNYCADIKNILNIKEFIELYDALESHGEIRLVGGCVRDIIMGQKPQDIDIATTILPYEVLSILNKNNIKSIKTGFESGTITALINNQSFEITTLRRDIKCYGRKVEVQFTDDWLEDASRRDFTMNALYIDMNGKIIDFFNGVQDIQNKLIRFVGDPMQRIREDFLRILRYFRFHSYIGVQNIDQDSYNASCTLANNLCSISGERIQTEMSKLFRGRFASEAFAMIQKSLIGPYIALPQFKDQAMNFITNDILIDLAAIFLTANAQDKDVEKCIGRWKMSNKSKKELLHLFDYHYPYEIDDDIKYHKREFYRIGKDLASKHLILEATIKNNELYTNKALEVIELSKSWIYPNFTINGNDLIRSGFKGKEIGVKINEIKEIWIGSDFQSDQKDILQRMKQ